MKFRITTKWQRSLIRAAFRPSRRSSASSLFSLRLPRSVTKADRFLSDLTKPSKPTRGMPFKAPNAKIAKILEWLE